MIEVDQLVKWYGPVKAVAGISFKIEPGQIVGFLGPNGAGKSTTLRMLTGYIPPTSGSASIDGRNVVTQSAEARSRIGYLPESTPLYHEMRVTEYLHYRGKLMGMSRGDRKSRINTVCGWCGLDKVQRRLIGQLSKGNRQRVGLAQALLHDPPVLILDEPTAGLDPTQITHVRSMIAELKGKHTILLSTHILPEVERNADRVIIIAGGTIVADGTPASLRQEVVAGSRFRMEVKASPTAVETALSTVEGVNAVNATEQDGWTAALITPDKGADIREAVGAKAAASQWVVREMRHETASLEEFFIQITAAQQQQAPPNIDLSDGDPDNDTDTDKDADEKAA